MEDGITRPQSGKTDWQAEARRAANYVYENLFSEHRGVMPWSSGVLIFGNDGFQQDEKTKLQVTILRQYLSDAGITELSFATHDTHEEGGDPGYSWALIVDAGNLDRLHGILWEAHRISHSCAKDDALYACFKHIQGG